MKTLTVQQKIVTRFQCTMIRNSDWSDWREWDDLEEARQYVIEESKKGCYEYQLATAYYDMDGNYLAWNCGQIYYHGVVIDD